ncbi:MAG: HAD family phosphatase [Candidatus Riflebacteria bacterium]|nr:HAD family phosphatase [Candidatus Riflebacteria bacterium]
MIFEIDPVPIRMVLFDFGNVIAHIDHRRFTRLLTNQNEQGIERITRRLFGPATPGELLETGHISQSTFREDAMKIMGVHPSIDAFDTAFNGIIMSPIPEMLELIIDLSPHYRLGLLSNTSAPHFEQVISRIPVFERFDQVSLSYEVGRMKPDEAIFMDAIGKHPGSPASILYLDDIIQFVDAARGLGMQGLHVEEPIRAASCVRHHLLPPEHPLEK